jgi:hypothetical protein
MPISDVFFCSAEATPHLASTCQSPLAGRETLCPACRFVTSLLVDSHAVAMLPLAVQVGYGGLLETALLAVRGVSDEVRDPRSARQKSRSTGPRPTSPANRPDAANRCSPWQYAASVSVARSSTPQSTWMSVGW